MRLFLTLGFLSVLLSNCSKEKIILNIQTNGKMVLIDSSDLTENLLSYSVMENDGYYPIHFVGLDSDTILLQKRRIPMFGPKSAEFVDHIPIADSNKMVIMVDTSFNLSHTTYFQHFLEDGEAWILDSTLDFKAYPVIFRNICDSVLYLSDCWDWDNVVRQVKTKNGIWRDIEKPIEYWHCMGCNPIILEPNQLLIVKMLLYKGDTKVECRLKYENHKNIIYSNTFYDHLPQQQFTDPL